jgi:hypothetical protein
MNCTEINELKDLLTDCHIAIGDISNLAESLQRSVYAIELRDAVCCPDRILIEILAKRISELEKQIAEAL